MTMLKTFAAGALGVLVLLRWSRRTGPPAPRRTRETQYLVTRAVAARRGGRARGRSAA